MFPFGHVGLSILLVYLIDRAHHRYRKGAWVWTDWDFDVRVVVVIAVLPDVIDKLVGHVILAGSLDNGRIFSHTLLFWLVVTGLMAASMLMKDKFPLTARAWPLYSIALLCHTAFDQMWLEPETLLWPLYGMDFSSTDWEIMYWVRALYTNPYIMTTEFMGFCSLATFVLATRSYMVDRLKDVLRYGRPRGQVQKD